MKIDFELEHIHDEACPACGAKPSRIVKDRLHCNGSWNELVEYACGAKVHFSPNFMRTEWEPPCPDAVKVAVRAMAEKSRNPR